MALKVTIQPADLEFSGRYPTYFVPDAESVIVGPNGELKLVAESSGDGQTAEFRIYAPGTWKEINVSTVSEE